MSKIYDCFTYFDNDRLLKLRLETLWDTVDYFVICESELTQAGKPKPINFKPENYQKYMSKIRYLLIKTAEYTFDTNDHWANERFQRNYLENGFKDASDDDWIIISDIDEIPKPDSIKSFDPKTYVRAKFNQRCYYYYMNNLHVDQDGSPVMWDFSKITTYRAFKQVFGQLELVRYYKPKGLFGKVKKFWVNKFKTQTLDDSGWHFTWMGGVDKIILKLESMVHQEFNLPEFKNPEKILHSIRTGQDIFGRDLFYKLQSIDHQFPPYLLSHLKDYEDWFLPERQNLV